MLQTSQKKNSQYLAIKTPKNKISFESTDSPIYVQKINIHEQTDFRTKKFDFTVSPT